LFDHYIPLYFEQFDVVHDGSSNASSNSNYEASLHTCPIVKNIVFKSDVDDPCANFVSEPCFDFVDEPHVPLLEVTLLKGNLIMNLLV
jgi:hypothetical protein